MRRDRTLVAKSGAVLILLLLVPIGTATPAGSGASVPHDEIYPTTSWAVGIVVPEGAQLQGGGVLKWEDIGNLTSLVSLPYFNGPSGIVYAVMSVMTADGSVMQVAAGVYPNSSSWLSYSWAVQGVQTSRPTYDWVLNSSSPEMSAGDEVSLSIFKNQTSWDLKIVDLSTGAAIEHPFPGGVGLSLEPGDQEVFALESYSRTAADFQHMGNLTLNALLVDGRQVSSGFYAYGGWDPNRNPVFAVGSSGTSPPVFVSLQEEPGDSFVWSYVAVFPDSTISYTAVLDVLIAVSIAGAIAATCGAILVRRKGASQGPG